MNEPTVEQRARWYAKLLEHLDLDATKAAVSAYDYDTSSPKITADDCERFVVISRSDGQQSLQPVPPEYLESTIADLEFDDAPGWSVREVVDLDTGRLVEYERHYSVTVTDPKLA